MKFQESLFFSDNLWKLLGFFESHQNQVIALSELENVTGIHIDDLTQYFSFLRLFDVSFEIKDDHKTIHLGSIEPIKFELTFSEWLALQGHFPLLEGFNGKPFNDLLKDKLSLIEQKHHGTSLFDALEIEKELKESNMENSSSFAAVLEEINISESIAELIITGSKNISLYPHKLVHIDGSLNIVGEDTGDGCLIHIPVNSIDSVLEREKNEYSPKYSTYEINDFVQAIRSVSGSEERLVLKVKDQNENEFETGYHFMADPFITTNMDGEVIWAASVEVSDELFEWLFQLGENIEILDPSSIIDSFEEFKAQRQNIKKAA